MSGIEKFLNVLGFQVEWDDADQNESVQSAVKSEDRHSKQNRKAEVKDHSEPIKAALPSGTAQVILLEPEKITDAQKICNELKNGKTVVVNVEKLNQSDIIRLYDFASGATYALGGKMREISENVLVIAPINVDIQTSEVAKLSSVDDMDDDMIDDFEF